MTLMTIAYLITGLVLLVAGAEVLVRAQTALTLIVIGTRAWQRQRQS